MMVQAVVHRVYQFMHQYIQHLYRVAQGWHDEGVVDRIVRQAGRPALANVVAAQTAAGKADRHLHWRQGVALGGNQRLDAFNGG